MAKVGRPCKMPEITYVAKPQKPSKGGRKPKVVGPTGLVIMDRLHAMQAKADPHTAYDDCAKLIMSITGVRLESGQVIETVPPCGMKWLIGFLNTGEQHGQ